MDLGLQSRGLIIGEVCHQCTRGRADRRSASSLDGIIRAPLRRKLLRRVWPFLFGTVAVRERNDRGVGLRSTTSRSRK